MKFDIFSHIPAWVYRTWSGDGNSIVPGILAWLGYKSDVEPTWAEKLREMWHGNDNMDKKQ